MLAIPLCLNLHSLDILRKAQINKVQDASQKVTMHRPKSITIMEVVPNIRSCVMLVDYLKTVH